MILIPSAPALRTFAIEGLLDDLARGRSGREEAGEMLAQLRLAGDVANLERLARAVSALDDAGRDGGFPKALRRTN